jgi:hypothetical protein
LEIKEEKRASLAYFNELTHNNVELDKRYYEIDCICIKNFISIISFLLSNGINTNHINNKNESVLDTAENYLLGMPNYVANDIFKMLFNHGAWLSGSPNTLIDNLKKWYNFPEQFINEKFFINKHS